MKIKLPQRFISTLLFICGSLLLTVSFAYFQLITFPNQLYFTNDIISRQSAKGEMFLIGKLFKSSQLNIFSLMVGTIVGFTFIFLGFYARSRETHRIEEIIKKISKNKNTQID